MYVSGLNIKNLINEENQINILLINLNNKLNINYLKNN